MSHSLKFCSSIIFCYGAGRWAIFHTNYSKTAVSVAVTVYDLVLLPPSYGITAVVPISDSLGRTKLLSNW